MISRRGPFCLVFMLCAVSLVHACVAQEKAPDASLLPLLEKLVETDPAQSDTWRLIGRIHKSQGNTAGARNAFEEALKVRHDNAAAHFDLGMLLLETGRGTQADAHFHKVLTFAPQSSYANQLIKRKLASTEKPIRDAAFSTTDSNAASVEEAGYQIQTFDGADNLEERLDQLFYRDAGGVQDIQFRLEMGTLYNSNVSLTPISRELRDSEAASAQVFLNPYIEWTAFRHNDWRAGILGRGAFTVNESHQESFNLASFQPAVFLEHDMPAIGHNETIGRLDYDYSIDLLGGRRFGDRHSLTASATLISTSSDVLYAYVTAAVSEFRDGASNPAVNSLDGTAVSAGVSEFLSTEIPLIPSWSVGGDVEFADTQGADFRYNAVNLHSNLTIQFNDSVSFTPGAGIGYRDYYDFTGPGNRNELTWRLHGRLDWSITNRWIASAVVGYDRFASDVEAFDAERLESGLVFTYTY